MSTYKSKYYDPDKAHEYYLKTRKLKGYENRYGGSRGDGTSAASTSGYLSDSQKKALEQSRNSGSTSGFNQKGKEAAAYIQNQMEHERTEIVNKINKELDSKMLTKAQALVDQIKKARANGETVKNSFFKGRIKSMLGSVKKEKSKTVSKYKKEYKQKYKDEIDKLRSDDSMFS